MFNQKRFKEKASLRKTLAMHQEGSNKHSADDKVPDGILLNWKTKLRLTLFLLRRGTSILIRSRKCDPCKDTVKHGQTEKERKSR